MQHLARKESTILRRLHPDDMAIFRAYRSDPDVARYQSWPAMDDARMLGFLKAMQSVSPLFSLRHGDPRRARGGPHGAGPGMRAGGYPF